MKGLTHQPNKNIEYNKSNYARNLIDKNHNYKDFTTN